MSKVGLIGGAIVAAAFTAICVTSASAADDAYTTMAKEYIAKVTAPVTEWTGPTTGPKAQGKKLVIYVSDDQRN